MNDSHSPELDLETSTSPDIQPEHIDIPTKPSAKTLRAQRKETIRNITIGTTLTIALLGTIALFANKDNQKPIPSPTESPTPTPLSTTHTETLPSPSSTPPSTPTSLPTITPLPSTPISTESPTPISREACTYYPEWVNMNIIANQEDNTITIIANTPYLYTRSRDEFGISREDCPEGDHLDLEGRTIELDGVPYTSGVFQYIFTPGPDGNLEFATWNDNKVGMRLIGPLQFTADGTYEDNPEREQFEFFRAIFPPTPTPTVTAVGLNMGNHTLTPAPSTTPSTP